MLRGGTTGDDCPSHRHHADARAGGPLEVQLGRLLTHLLVEPAHDGGGVAMVDPPVAGPELVGAGIVGDRAGRRALHHMPSLPDEACARVTPAPGTNRIGAFRYILASVLGEPVEGPMVNRINGGRAHGAVGLGGCGADSLIV